MQELLISSGTSGAVLTDSWEQRGALEAAQSLELLRPEGPDMWQLESEFIVLWVTTVSPLCHQQSDMG